MVVDKDLPKRGDIVAGKYQIDGILGTGGMGAVYQVTHRVTGKSFAIKWLLPQLRGESDAVHRFIREAQVAGRVDHPNVVEVYDVGQEGESFYMVMELLQGESLAQRIARKTQLSASECAQILIPVTRGLTAAHNAGVIHRDLKPDNIFLCHTHEGTDQPKVLDFGISKMSALNNAVTDGITRQGAVMGTPHYMAPEQVRSQPVDARTDVYALGVILYQALTGSVPFPGESYSELVLKIISEAPKPLAALAPQTPAALIAVVDRAMSRDPAQRYASSLEFGQALQPFAQGMRVESLRPADPSQQRVSVPGPQTPLSTESHVGQRSAAAHPPRRMIIAATGAGALALAGLAALLLHTNHAPGDTHAGKLAPTSIASPPVVAPAPAVPTPALAHDTDELPIPRTVLTEPQHDELPRGATPPSPELAATDEPAAQSKLAAVPAPPMTGSKALPPKAAGPAHAPTIELPGTAPKRTAPTPTKSSTAHRTTELSVDDF